MAITPCRLLDTRGTATGFSSGAPYNAPIAAAGTLTIPVLTDPVNAACGTVPSIAQAYSVNITLIPVASGQVNFLTVWPAGATQPVVATMNDKTGLILANAAIVPAGPLVSQSGGISVYNSGPSATNVVIDMNGFFTAPTDLGFNTGLGEEALASNTSGAYNTASGFDALASNTTGGSNTASGYGALSSNNGSFNTASGFQALANNTTGSYNTADGYVALGENITGGNNVAVGTFALYVNSGGSNNTAIGPSALESNQTGINNIAIGSQAGISASSGNSHSIYIGSQGTPSDASGTIQIGTQGTQTGGTFIAGIYNASVGASNSVVCVDSTGMLGTGGTCNSTPSSLRFKEQIADMGDHSSKLYDLRPVNFSINPEYDDGSHILQFGLIAEEVAEVFPEMVMFGKDGSARGPSIRILTPMLLNELQKQARQIRSLEERLAAIERHCPRVAGARCADASVVRKYSPFFPFVVIKSRNLC